MIAPAPDQRHIPAPGVKRRNLIHSVGVGHMKRNSPNGLPPDFACDHLQRFRAGCVPASKAFGEINPGHDFDCVRHEQATVPAPIAEAAARYLRQEVFERLCPIVTTNQIFPCEVGDDPQ